MRPRTAVALAREMKAELRQDNWRSKADGPSGDYFGGNLRPLHVPRRSQNYHQIAYWIPLSQKTFRSGPDANG